MFSSLAPLFLGAIPVIALHLICTVEKKPAYCGDTNGFEMLWCKAGDELRTKDSDIDICTQYSNRTPCNVFAAIRQWPRDTLPTDTLLSGQYRQCKQSAGTLPSPSASGGIDRLPTPWPQWTPAV
ncbi:hypothetical protein BTVI_157568 [Pitangus sulphuratus]|nr:hypothetical protein BTVI_157568 [Pitangus sulphuratus]